MNTIKETKEETSQHLSEAKIRGIIMEDILFRSPFYGIAVLIILGGISFSFIWFILNILRPYIMNY